MSVDSKRKALQLWLKEGVENECGRNLPHLTKSQILEKVFRGREKSILMDYIDWSSFQKLTGEDIAVVYSYIDIYVTDDAEWDAAYALLSQEKRSITDYL